MRQFITSYCRETSSREFSDPEMLLGDQNHRPIISLLENYSIWTAKEEGVACACMLILDSNIPVLQ